VPIGVVFCWVWIKERKRWKEYFVMYGIFAILIIPIALWFPIRNIVLYKMPIVWSPPTSGMKQYTGDFPLWKRFFDLDPIQFKTLCVSWYEGFWEGVNYVEHNIPLAFVKHLTFSDWPYCMYTSLYYLISAILLFMVSVIVVTCVVMLVYWMLRGEEALLCKVFILTTVVAFIEAYLYFIFSKPYVAAMNMRYVLPLVVMIYIGGILGLQRMMKTFASKTKTVISKLIGVGGLFYTAVSIGLFCLFMIKA